MVENQINGMKFNQIFILLISGWMVAPAMAYYQPESGRFMQRDKLRYVDGMNLYEYVISNPNRFSDPLGLCLGSVCDVDSVDMEGDLIDEISNAFLSDTNCCGGTQYDPKKECCENNRVVQKESVYVINRGGPDQLTCSPKFDPSDVRG